MIATGYTGLEYQWFYYSVYTDKRHKLLISLYLSSTKPGSFFMKNYYILLSRARCASVVRRQYIICDYNICVWLNLVGHDAAGSIPATQTICFCFYFTFLFFSQQRISIFFLLIIHINLQKNKTRNKIYACLGCIEQFL